MRALERRERQLDQALAAVAAQREQLAAIQAEYEAPGTGSSSGQREVETERDRLRAEQQSGGRHPRAGPRSLRYDGAALAQLGERRLCKPEVIGSIPIRSIAEAFARHGVSFPLNSGSEGNSLRSCRCAWPRSSLRSRRYDGSAPGSRAPPCPSMPTQVFATAGDGQVTVAWVASASNGGFPITQYTVSTSVFNGPTCTWSSGPEMHVRRTAQRAELLLQGERHEQVRDGDHSNPWKRRRQRESGSRRPDTCCDGRRSAGDCELQPAADDGRADHVLHGDSLSGRSARLRALVSS